MHKIIINDSDFNEALGSMHQSIMMKIKNYVCEDWIVETIFEHGLRFLSVSIHENNSIEKWRQ